ncbi:predicted protein [Histoplasma capsulatum var. duboisii H88]|uniref:Predicted protein n=1 Tax=Ajellomyces capsulatus (strain H88) TaxID=544711 RepID=F0UI46_AJEC8|nr:predicted protein [Histoplasma capsulatum var. duboisii H88]
MRGRQGIHVNPRRSRQVSEPASREFEPRSINPCSAEVGEESFAHATIPALRNNNIINKDIGHRQIILLKHSFHASPRSPTTPERKKDSDDVDCRLPITDAGRWTPPPVNIHTYPPYRVPPYP